MVLKISLSQGLSIAYIFTSSMAAILFLVDGPKSIIRPLDNMKTKFEVLKKSHSQRLSIAYIFDGGHLVFSRWPNVYSVRPLNNIKTNFKFEVDWGNGPKDTAFTRVVHSKHFQKFNGGYLVFNRWPKIKAPVL